MQTGLTIIHVIICILLVLVVLIQSGKGSEIGVFGGSSQTIFGSSGGATFFTRFTSVLATLFMTTSILLTWMSTHSHQSLFEARKRTQKVTETLQKEEAKEKEPHSNSSTSSESEKK